MIAKKRVPRLFLPLLLVLLGMATIATVLVPPMIPMGPSPVVYSVYEDDSASLPGQLARGDMFVTTWRPYPDTWTRSARHPTRVTLSVVLVPLADFAPGSCGGYKEAIVLDRMTTTNASRQWYRRTVRIPGDVAPGSYELVHRGQEARLSWCAGRGLTVEASLPTGSPVRQVRRQVPAEAWCGSSAATTGLPSEATLTSQGHRAIR
jgi:hypothetical protein